ncbi:MAG: zinc-binding dehydrogenase [Hyphomonadaceae bacterium]|nr:zinc-binding dehydrogenase [Hyphomonadaceae bacterium]
MKIVRYHEKGLPEVLQVEDAPTPILADGQVLVRIEACGIKYGEVLQRSGKHYPIPVTLPFLPGGSIAGVVEQVAPKANADLLGKRVYCSVTSGGYAEYIAVPDETCVPIPENVDSVSAVAVLSDGVTASILLKHAARIQPGQSIFIPAAAGGLGNLALQLAKIYGATNVICAASTPEKRQAVLDLGANAVIDYTKEGWSRDVLAANGGVGVDIALEMTGGAVFYETLEIVKPGGVIVNYGNASDTPAPVNPRDLLRKGLTLVGFATRVYPQYIRSTCVELLDLLSKREISAQFQTYPLDQAFSAHAAIENRSSQGRQILVPST